MSERIDVTLIKSVGGVFLGALAAFFFGLGGWQALITDVVPYALLISTGLLWIALVLLSVFLVHTRSAAFYVALSYAFTFTLPFAQPVRLLLLLPFAALTIFLWFALVRGRRALDGALTVQFFGLCGRMVAYIFTGLALWGALYGALYFTEKGFSEATETQTTRVLQFATPGVSWLIPDFSPSTTVGTLFQKVAERQVPPGTESKYVDILVNDWVKRLSETWKTRVDPTEGIAQASARIVQEKAPLLPAQTKHGLILGLVFLIFLSVKGIGFFVGLIAVPIAFLFFQFLVALGFFHMGVENRSKEIVLLK